MTRDINRIVVLAPNWLGDAVMALPAIADVKRHFPSARLIVAARPAVARLFSMAPAVDEVLTLEWRGRVLQRQELKADVDRLTHVDADTALLLPNSFAAAWLVKRARIGARWGYATDFRRPLLSRAVLRPRGSVHQGEYYQHLVRELGIRTGPLEPDVRVPKAAEDTARDLLLARGYDGTRPLVVMAPGAAYGKAKQWLPAHFASLASMLVRERGACIAFVGSAADADATRSIRDSMSDDTRARVADLAAATTLETLAGVLALARACVSNDSGAMHLAAAVGVPLAALFGPTREHETSPLPRAGSRADVLINPVFCRPCMLRECPIDHRCMKGLLPERVFTSVTELMTLERPR